MPGPKTPGNRIRDTSTRTPTPKSRPKPKSKPSAKPTPTTTAPHPPGPNTPPSRPTTAPSRPTTAPSRSPTTTTTHQKILTTFATAFHTRFNDDLTTSIQTLKHHLYLRDFEAAFKDPEALEAYSVRWSARRGCAYADVLGGMGLLGVGEDKDRGKGRRKVVCLGGGAGAEVVALGFGGWKGEWDIVVVDIAPWGSVLRKLETVMKASSSSLVTSNTDSDCTGTADKRLMDPAKKINVMFQQRDILDLSGPDFRDLCRDTKMVTLMFTLNELYGISIAKTTGMLLGLTGWVERGCLLVVVDSPGSYSTLALKNNYNNDDDEKNKDGSRSEEESVGSGVMEKEKKQKEVKKYPMKWLLDHTFLEVASAAGAGGGDEGTKSDAEGGKRWEKIQSEDSRWCRLREELRYPIALEDMRMQVHVYRRL
ncbi:MAG: hypothetical protein LQ339_001500 [Xanthoria mediterranea]|nr:MAG: hypothetical protein LQ339_001500 [Xanthoria mediterranea]